VVLSAAEAVSAMSSANAENEAVGDPPAEHEGTERRTSAISYLSGKSGFAGLRRTREERGAVWLS
jgi:hypothetical protein